jgi:DNA-binding GntR family transcriptional regulator
MESKIDKTSLEVRAAEWIRNAITSGGLALGQRLTEVDLAEQIGLSRSTVRSAMQRLVADGLIVQKPYTGWEVVSLSAQGAWELYTLRSRLEGLAARLAAENIDQPGRDSLVRSLDRLKAALASREPRQVAEMDLQVHQTIVSLSKHQRLAAHHALISGTTLLYILSTNRMMERPDAILPDHENLVKAILEGDADAAEHAASDHVTVHGQHLVDMLRSRESHPADQEPRKTARLQIVSARPGSRPTEPSAG